MGSKSVADIGKLLQEHAEAQGLSATQLAGRAGLSCNTVTRLFRGAVNTRVGSIVKVSEALGLAFEPGFLPKQ